MLKRLIAIVLGVLAVAVLSALISESRNVEIIDARLSASVEAQSPADARSNCERPDSTIQAADVIDNFDQLSLGDYLVQKRQRMAKLDVPREYGPPPKPVKISYVVVQREGKIIAKFDGDIFFSLGNSTDAGFFDLLNNGNKQLIVSQDVFRTGVQWVADFSKGFKLIFDGRKFRVGRESSDMTISDYDGDGIKEILAPITAFYGLQGLRSTGDTPLPVIVFKYNPRLQAYLPANPEFRECLLAKIEAADKSLRALNEQPSLGRIMSVSLDYIFAGDEQRAWKFFDETCKLPDKSRIKDNIKRLLNKHPVYRFLYQNSRPKKDRS